MLQQEFINLLVINTIFKIFVGTERFLRSTGVPTEKKIMFQQKTNVAPTAFKNKI